MRFVFNELYTHGNNALLYLWDQRVNFGVLNLSISFIADLLFPKLENCRKHIIFSSIAYQSSCFAKCLAYPIFLSKFLTNFVFTKSADCMFSTFDCNLYKQLPMHRIHKFSELSCLYCNLPYQFIKYASCLVCINFLKFLSLFLSPDFVDFSIFYSISR
jgi:hypothetical protein